MEALWLLLGLIGLTHGQTRVTSAALLLMGYAQLEGFERLTPHLSDAFSIMVELLTACICALSVPVDKPRWSLAVIELFAASLMIQTVALFLRGFGLPVDWLLFLTTASIYTGQLLCSAYPGGRAIAHSVRPRRLFRRRRDRDVERIARPNRFPVVVRGYERIQEI